MRLLSQRLVLLGSLALLSLALSGCGGLLDQSNDDPVVMIITATPASGAAPSQASTPVPDPAPPSDEEPTPDAAAVVPSDDPAPPDPAPVQAGPGLLARVQARGNLICGTNADLPGFGFYDQVRGSWTGFDVDFCRTLAAAIFGDANAVEFVGLTTSGPNERFAAVREGRVDVLFRNTTWTIGRDLGQLAFGPTTFHDGQTFMVRADAGINNSNDLAGRRV
ncbi:MAG: transporter substrate-binding domain-containing protein, partial [Candidatus Viridilinea halotolerans]